MYHWLLVEGIYLYIKVGLVFNSDRIKMWMYGVIGWGLPLVHSLIFCLMMKNYNDNTCWFIGDSSINWTRRGPILFILAFNLLILLHIIRILMTQMQTGQLNHDSNQVKKAIKATLVLSPLLGITYIVLLVSPGTVLHLRKVLHYNTNLLFSITRRQIIVFISFLCLHQHFAAGIARLDCHHILLFRQPRDPTCVETKVLRLAKANLESASGKYLSSCLNPPKIRRLDDGQW